eukprot:TRINITY_DN1759_c0_g1_i2.p1 TRINITY_DN1759_c0_g1~~TRINITY_DN1759_c0_g1_i2.p1  ORF type:complete len:460 (-),score=64.31 TRINITY_DN1759_c0_g1_i2:68-1321(-)
MGRKPSLVYAVSKGNKLYFQKLRGDDKDRVNVVQLKGCVVIKRTITLKDSVSQFQVEIYHQYGKELWGNIYYISLLFSSPRDADTWYSYLKSVCVEQKNLSRLDSTHDWVPGTYVGKESVVWFNALLARWYLNFKESSRIQTLLFQRFSRIISNVINKRKLQTKLSDITITQLDLGVAPVLANVELIPPDNTGNLVFEADFTYIDGLCVGISAILQLEIKGTKIAKLLIGLTIKISTIIGKIRFRCPPHPSTKFMIMFLDPPEMDFQVKVTMGHGEATGLLRKGLDKVRKIVKKQLKTVFLSKVLAPNRMYINIPFTKEKSTAQVFTNVRLGTPPKHVETSTLDDEVAQKLESSLPHIAKQCFSVNNKDSSSTLESNIGQKNVTHKPGTQEEKEIKHRWYHKIKKHKNEKRKLGECE